MPSTSVSHTSEIPDISKVYLEGVSPEAVSYFISHVANLPEVQATLNEQASNNCLGGLTEEDVGDLTVEHATHLNLAATPHTAVNTNLQIPMDKYIKILSDLKAVLTHDQTRNTELMRESRSNQTPDERLEEMFTKVSQHCSSSNDVDWGCTTQLERLGVLLDAFDTTYSYVLTSKALPNVISRAIETYTQSSLSRIDQRGKGKKNRRKVLGPCTVVLLDHNSHSVL